MDDRKQVATARFRLHSGEMVFQRRREDARNPNMLGLFGGHFEPCDRDDPLRALRRELKEETGLDVGKLAVKKHNSIFIPERFVGDDLLYHIHEIDITHADFEVSDGPGAEVLGEEEALASGELEPAILYVLRKERGMQ
ncbi:MAG TPA: NUDIX domain-containing protein [Candidatus Saccharimonadales bacterium]|nr:NUDIX domain-containing protein [Candidatus Saccharimonadales bacterium]